MLTQTLTSCSLLHAFTVLMGLSSGQMSSLYLCGSELCSLRLYVAYGSRGCRPLVRVSVVVLQLAEVDDRVVMAGLVFRTQMGRALHVRLHVDGNLQAFCVIRSTAARHRD